MPSAQAWEGCIAVMRLSFFRGADYGAIARAIYVDPDRFRHRWSEQVFFPLVLAALGGHVGGIEDDASGISPVVGDLDVRTAGCHGDHPGALEQAVGRLHCEMGQTHEGLRWMAAAVNLSAVPLTSPDQHYHAIYAANMAVCALEHVKSVVTASSAALQYARQHSQTPIGRAKAEANLRALTQTLTQLGQQVQSSIG